MLIQFDQNGWGIAEYTGVRDGNYTDVHAVADGIAPELAYWDGSAATVKTQAERDAYDAEQAAAAETAFQAAKPLRLKQRENKYLGIIGELIAAGVPLAAGDDSDSLEAKIEAASLTDTEKLKFSARLLAAMNDITQNGGTWDGLPAQPHNLEE